MKNCNCCITYNAPDLMDGGVTAAQIEEEAGQDWQDAGKVGNAAYWRSRTENAERERDSWESIAQQTARSIDALRAEQPRPLTQDAIESVLHDILPLTANRLGEDDIASIASDLYLALTAPARDPRAEEMQADLATAEEPEMDDEDRRLIADHLAALGYRKAES